MASLNWQESSQKTSGNSQRASAPVSTNNPWFVFSLGLIGLIVGFGIGKWRGGSFPIAAGTPSAQVVQAPTPKPTLQLPPNPSKVQAPSTSARTIKMTAELWKFTPSVIRVKKGERVTLEITGVTGTHGLSVPGLGINETIIQGNTVSVDIPTDKAGTFDFRCSILCGSGHNDMTGQIIVEA